MTKLHFITNSIAAVTETTYDGKAYLVAPVVAIREGVLNDILYQSADIALHAASWNSHVVPIGHPQRNGEYVSANSRDVWATEVVGNFWDVVMDNDRLKGDIWVDLEKAEKLGEPALDIVNKLRAGEPIEVSTGVLVDLEETAGVWNGKSYSGIARNIFPDHLALLPNEVGACSWDDGCGVPRVNTKGEGMLVNEKDLNDRAVLVRRAFWQKVWEESEADGMTGDYDVLSIFDKTLIAKDWVTQTHAAFPYTLANDSSEVTFGEPTPVDVVYRAKEGGAEIVVVNEEAQPSDKQVSLFARIGQWLKADKTDSEQVAAMQQEEENVKKCDLVAALATNKAVKTDRAVLETWDEAVLQAFHDSLKVNEEVVEPVTPIVPEVVAPAIPEWQQAIADLTAKVDGVLSAITANADQEKAGLVADIIANEQCKLNEAQLKGMDVDTLRALVDTFQVRDYSGAAGVVRNSGDNKDFVMEMPKLEWAVKEGK